MPQSSFDLFVFDFDGTLGDSKINIANSMNFALKQSGYEPVDPIKIYPMIGKLILADMFTTCYPEIGDAQLSDMLSLFRAYQREHLISELTLFPQAQETLETLKDNDKHLAILTSKHIGQMQYTLEAFNLTQFFDVVVGDGSLNQKKPHRSCVDHIWKTISHPISAERTVMIGDSEVDVQMAKNAGITMIAVGHGVDSAETLIDLGAEVAVQTLSQLLEFM